MYKVLQEVNAIEWTPEMYNFVVAVVRSKKLENFDRDGFSKVHRVGHLFWVKEMEDPVLGTREHLGITNLGKPIVVVQTTEKQSVMEKLYRNVLTTANGRDSFWSQIANRYAGISRADVVKFLPNQEAYQRHRPVKVRKDVIPIATSAPSELWQVDTIDMNKLSSQNGQFSRCMTVVDHFSKYAWVKALKDNTAMSTATAMNEILMSLPPKLRPRRVQSDNGTEFKGEFEALLRSLKINQSHSYAYTPHAQGCVEVFNKTFKSKVYQLLTLNDNRKWVDFLPEIMDNYNSTRHSRTRWAPKDLFLGTKNQEVDTKIQYDLAERMKFHRKKFGLENQKNEPKMKGEGDPRIIKAGDYVRISKHTWNPDARMLEGERPKVGAFTKKYLANWSREVYIVHKVTVPRYAKDFENKFWYSLRSVDGYVLQRQFYRQEVMKVDIDKTQNGKGEELTAKRVAEESKGKVEQEIEITYNRRSAQIAKKEANKLAKTPHPWLLGHILEIFTKGKWVTKGMVIECKYMDVPGTGVKKRKALYYSIRDDTPPATTTEGVAKSGKVYKSNKKELYSRVSPNWINNPKGNTGSAWRIRKSRDGEIVRSSQDVKKSTPPPPAAQDVDFEELDRLEQEAMDAVADLRSSANPPEPPAIIKKEEEPEIPLTKKPRKKRLATEESRWKKFYTEDRTLWEERKLKEELDDIANRLNHSNLTQKARFNNTNRAIYIKKELERLDREGWKGPIPPLDKEMLAKYESGYRSIQMFEEKTGQKSKKKSKS